MATQQRSTTFTQESTRPTQGSESQRFRGYGGVSEMLKVFLLLFGETTLQIDFRRRSCTASQNSTLEGVPDTELAAQPFHPPRSLGACLPLNPRSGKESVEIKVRKDCIL
jgi:hypothetical protein